LCCMFSLLQLETPGKNILRVVMKLLLSRFRRRALIHLAIGLCILCERSG
jgi:hypothetical protein